MEFVFVHETVKEQDMQEEFSHQIGHQNAVTPGTTIQWPYQTGGFLTGNVLMQVRNRLTTVGRCPVKADLTLLQ
jgi:hypothetical protein